jgi:hypothetical protein
MVDKGFYYVQLQRVADLIVGASANYPTGQIRCATDRENYVK